MNGLELFVLTRVEERGRFWDWINSPFNLEDIANSLLTPLHVLWHGRTVRIVRSTFKEDLEDIHHVASFHPQGEEHISHTDKNLYSSQYNWIVTALAILCLIPGLFFGFPLKVISQAGEEARTNYKLVCDHFSTVSVDIGNSEIPITEKTEDTLFTLAEKKLKPLNKKVSHILIHGDGKFVLSARGDLMQRLNPKKIILVGTALSRGETPSFFLHPQRAIKESKEKLVDEFREFKTGDFLPAIKATGKFELEGDLPKIYTVKSIAEAKQHTPPKRANGKPYHAMYHVKEPAQSHAQALQPPQSPSKGK